MTAYVLAFAVLVWLISFPYRQRVRTRRVLAFLEHAHDVGGLDIVKVTGVPRGSIYVVLDRLEQEGLVTYWTAGSGRRMYSLVRDELDLDACWCGEDSPYYDEAVYQSGCDGDRYMTCRCGGDLCVCHNHGEVECYGCDDCEGDEDDDYEEYCVECGVSGNTIGADGRCRSCPAVATQEPR